MRALLALLFCVTFGAAAYAQGSVGTAGGVGGGNAPWIDPVSALHNRSLDLGTGTLTAAAVVSNGPTFLGSWTTAGRPNLSSTQFSLGYNTTLGRFDYWNGAAWSQYVNLAGDTMTGALTLSAAGTALTVNNKSTFGASSADSPSIAGGGSGPTLTANGSGSPAFNFANTNGALGFWGQTGSGAPVNQLQFRSAPSGSTPSITLAGSGSDAAIGLNLSLKNPSFWLPSTGYANNAFVQNADSGTNYNFPGAVYQQTSGSTCTSGTSGGPTGHTSPQTDGTCSWTYLYSAGAFSPSGMETPNSIQIYPSIGSSALGTLNYTGQISPNNPAIIPLSVNVGHLTGALPSLSFDQPIVSVWVGNDSAQLADNQHGIADILVNHNLVAGWVGNRFGADIGLTISGPPAVGIPGVGIPALRLGSTISGSSMGGSSGHPIGLIEPIDIVSGAHDAPNLEAVSGGEINITVSGTSSTLRKDGLSITQTAASTVAAQVPDWDTAFQIGNGLGAVGWHRLISLGSGFGQWPTDTTGTLIGVQRGQNWSTYPVAYAYGIDMYNDGAPSVANMRFPASIGPWMVDQNGGNHVGAGYISATSTGLAIDVPGSVGSAVTIQSGGAGYVNNDVFYFGTGGVGHVVANASGVVTAIAIEHYPYVLSGSVPGNPLSTTTWPLGAGSGLTLNVTAWAGTGHLLSLQPSALGDVLVGGTSALSLSATTGFLDPPTTAGIPTGAPGSGLANCAIDTTNGYLNCYFGGSWHKIQFAAGAG